MRHYFALLLPLLLSPAAFAQYNAFQNSQGSTVSVFDLTSDSATGAIAIGYGSVYNMAVSPNGNSIFINPSPGGFLSGALFQANVSKLQITKNLNLALSEPELARVLPVGRVAAALRDALGLSDFRFGPG